MKLIHISMGGPDRWLSCSGKVLRFEEHPYCGPILLCNKTGEIATNQPPEKHPFWSHVNAWYQQGKRTVKAGDKVWCKYETDRMAVKAIARRAAG